MDLDSVEDFDEKYKLERFISDIDNRLVQLFSKMISSGKQKLEPTVKLDEINEDEIKEFVRDLILSDEDPYSMDIYTEDDMEFAFIKKTKCDTAYARDVIDGMKKHGLGLCTQSYDELPDNLQNPNNEFSTLYSLMRFSILRDYLTKDEISSIKGKRLEIKQKIEYEKKKKEEEVSKRCGTSKEPEEKKRNG